MPVTTKSVTFLLRTTTSVRTSRALYAAGIAKIEIERDNAKIKINIHCSRPGVIIGKGGPEIERLRLELEKKLGKTVALNIVEVRSPD